MKKDKSETKILSKNKRRWLPIGSRHQSCTMSEKEADEFIKQKGNDDVYYFLKTLS